MDPRRLNTAQIRNILNCEPPKHAHNEARDAQQPEQPRLLLNLPKAVERPTNAEPPQTPNNDKQSNNPGTRINTKDNPELLQYLPQVPKNATVYIDINIYVVEDDSHTGQTHIPGEHTKSPKPPSDFNNSPILSEHMQVPEPLRINKLVIPSISHGLKKNGEKSGQRDVWRNDGAILESDDGSGEEVGLRKRESLEGDECASEGSGDAREVEDVVKSVSDYWTKKPALYPHTFVNKAMTYNAESGNYFNVESVDYSSKMMRK